MPDGTKQFYLKNHQGSTTRIVTESGSAEGEWVYSYLPYGMPKMVMSGNGQDVTEMYTGKEYDQFSNFYYFRNRWYSPELGRFISRDPIGYRGDPINLYRFEGNGPVNGLDPMGLYNPNYPIRDAQFQNGQQKQYDESNQGTHSPSNEIWDATSDFLQNYSDMRDANFKNSDKYFHCKANCQAAKRGEYGKSTSEVISETREITDYYIKGDPAFACNEDRTANDHGRNGGNSDVKCEDICSKYRPKGLPEKY